MRLLVLAIERTKPLTMAENAEPNKLDHGQKNAVTVSMAPILLMILVSINVSNSILVIS